MRNLVKTVIGLLAVGAMCTPAEAAKRSTLKKTKASNIPEYRITIHTPDRAYYRGIGATGLRDRSAPFFASPPDGEAFFADIAHRTHD